MIKNILSIFIGITICSLFGCQELVELELPEQPPQLVVEAEITNTAGPHFVRLSLTQDYFSEEELPPVSDANVKISDDEGNEFNLYQAEPGLYVVQEMEGKIGRTYTLHIEWNNNLYESSGTLLQEAVIDSLNYQYFERNPIFKEGYYLFFFGALPPDRDNYFRIKVYKNDSLYNNRSDILVQSDELLPNQDRVENLRLTYPFKLGDTVRLEMYTLNQDMYQYYLEFITLLYNDGGLFSPPPQNPNSNIRNITNPNNPPLGYFQVASLTWDVVIIKEENEE